MTVALKVALMAVAALARREIVRFWRERTRVVGALLQPVMFWVLFSAGLGASFRPPGGSAPGYAAYLFPGIVVLILLFTAIFSTISLIEDRREGFLQGVLVAPVPRACIVLGKVAGGTALAVAQAAVVLLCAPLVGLRPGILALAGALGVLAILGFALTALSFCIAWRMRSTQGFHAIMTVFLMPLWLLSGAFFPAEGAPLWLRALIAADPLTYGLASLRRILEAGAGSSAAPTPGAGLPPAGASLALTFLFGAAALGCALLLARRSDGRDVP
jgi:ABC-2 type transport system permease protein